MTIDVTKIGVGDIVHVSGHGIKEVKYINRITRTGHITIEWGLGGVEDDSVGYFYGITNNGQPGESTPGLSGPTLGHITMHIPKNTCIKGFKQFDQTQGVKK